MNKTKWKPTSHGDGICMLKMEYNLFLHANGIVSTWNGAPRYCWYRDLAFRLDGKTMRPTDGKRLGT